MRSSGETFSRSVVGVCLLAAACSRSIENKSPEGVVAAQVHLVRPARRSVNRTISLPANVEALEQSPVYARVSGYVSRVAVDIGDRVEAGQVLAALEIPEMASQLAQASQQQAQQRADLSRAGAEATLRRVVFARARGLRAKDAITAQDLDEAKARDAEAIAELELARARAQGAAARVAELTAVAQYVTVRAPFAGVITRRFADRGALVQAATSSNTPLLVVARTDTLRVVAAVPEPDVLSTARGNPVEFSCAALPGDPFAGEITRLAEALEPSSRTMRAEVYLPNPDNRLRPGMFGTLTITVEQHPDAVTLPESAVRQEKTRALVYAVEGDRAAERVVKLGFAANGQIEILAGVGEGDAVISPVVPGLANGSPVHVADQRSSGGTP